MFGHGNAGEKNYEQLTTQHQATAYAFLEKPIEIMTIFEAKKKKQNTLRCPKGVVGNDVKAEIELKALNSLKVDCFLS